MPWFDVGSELVVAAADVLDQRKPQDYFHRVWSTAFRAADLAAHGDDEYSGEELAEACA